MIFLPLLAACLHRASADVPGNAVACTDEEQCRQQFLAANPNGYFYVNTFPSKGCFTKNGNGYFGTGGTVDEMSTADMPGIQERLWCDIATDVPTYAPSRQPTSSPTQLPTTLAPSKSPTPKPSSSPSTRPSKSPSYYAPSTSVRVDVYLSLRCICHLFFSLAKLISNVIPFFTS